MGVNRRNYGRALEGESKKKQSLTAMHKAAVKKSRVKSKGKSLLEKTAERLTALRSGKWKAYKKKITRTAKELVGGSKTYLKKK